MAISKNSGKKQCRNIATLGNYCRYHDPQTYLKAEETKVTLQPEEPGNKSTIKKVNTIDDMVDVLSRVIAQQGSKASLSAKELSSLASLSRAWLTAKNEQSKEQLLKPALKKLKSLGK